MALTVGVNAYMDEATADAYFADTLRNDAWNAFDTTTKEAALIDATSYIDRLEWQGEKAVPAQDLEWPRVGVPGIDDPEVFENVENSSAEIALQLATNPNAINSIDDQTGDNTKRVKADTVEVEFFFNQSSLNGGPLSPWVDALIGEWLASSVGGLKSGVVTGNDGESVFTRDKAFINSGLY